jgi:hypothetical protein
MLAGACILLVVDDADVQQMERTGNATGLRRKVERAGGRLSVNGVPPLPAVELSHILARGRDVLGRLAPSLARRYDGVDGPPPKRQRRGGASEGAAAAAAAAAADVSASSAEGQCCLVTPAWLRRSLDNRGWQPEHDYTMPHLDGNAGAAAAGPAVPPVAPGAAETRLEKRLLPGYRNTWYIGPEVLGPEAPLPDFQEMWALRPHEPHKIDVSYGRGPPDLVDLPRLSQAYGTDYSYSTVRTKPAPRHTPACIEKLRVWVSQLLQTDFNGVLVNWYRDSGDNISAHSDAEDSLVPGAPIASITLGDARTFRVTEACYAPFCQNKAQTTGVGCGHKKRGKAVEVGRFELGDRCLFVMGGAEFQTQFRHEITKDTRELPLDEQPRRINFTFRSHAK